MNDTTTSAGMSKEAWAAIGGIGAAAVTGIVTLLIHIIPSAPTPSATASTGPPSSTTASAGSEASEVAVGSIPAGMVGRWEGDASTGDGSGFTISLDISQQCTLGQVCGSIGVSQVPCYGRVSLEGVDGDDAEFRVSDFDQRSNTASCQAGAGEHFRLLSDGRLSYHTTYEPVAQGILTRQSRSRTHTKRGNAQPRQGL